MCQRDVPEAQLAAACSDLSPVYPISPTKKDMMRAAVRRMSRCSPKPTGYCHPDGPPLCRRRPRLLRMEERNDKNTWRCPSQSADSEAAIGGERTSVTTKQSTICSGVVVMRTKAGEGGGAPGEGRLFGWGQRGLYMTLENHPSALTILEYI